MCNGEADWFVLVGQEGLTPKITFWAEDDTHTSHMGWVYDGACIELEIYNDHEKIGTLSSRRGESESGEFEISGTCYMSVKSVRTERTEYAIVIEP